MVNHSPESQQPRWLTWIALGAILLIGGSLRLYAVGEHPYGVYQDEAVNGLDALRVLSGEFPLYFEANNGREPLFIYLVAAGVGLFGRTPLGLRAASALLGLLTIPAAYLLGHAWRNRRTGLVTAALLAVTLWHVHLSRISFRALSLPLFAGLALAVGALALRRQSRGLAIVAGALYGLSFYTYLAVRFSPLALIGMALYGWIWHRDWLGARGRLIGWMAAASFIVVLPLGIYTLLHPDIVLGRSDQVAIWNRPDFLSVLIQNIARSAGAFTWRGDWIWRHNVPNRPVFDPLMSLAFLGGVILTLRRWRKEPALALSVIWVAVMLLPTLLADDAPHFLRMAGVLPVVILIPAAALDAGAEWVRDRFSERMAAAGLIALLSITAGLSARDYFGCRSPMPVRFSGFDYVGCYRTDPVRGYFFQAEATTLAREVNAAEGIVYLDRRFWETFPSVRFLVDRPNTLSLYTDREVLTSATLPFSIFAWPHADLQSVYASFPPEAAIRIVPGPETRGDAEPVPYRLYVQYAVTSMEGMELSKPLARFANGLELLKVEAQASRSRMVVWLHWRASQPQTQPSQVFIHLIDQDGNIIAQIDEPPGTVYYPSLSWSRGSVIIQRAELAASQPPERSLRVGLYDPASSERIPILESSVSQQDNTLLLNIGGNPEP